MAAIGLVAAAPKIIFDYGANSYKQVHMDWVWVNPETWQDPFRKTGYFVAQVNITGTQEFIRTDSLLTSHKQHCENALPTELSFSILRQALDGVITVDVGQC